MCKVLTDLNTFWIYVTGFMFGVGLLGIPVLYIIIAMWSIAGEKTKTIEFRSYRKISTILGFIERFYLILGLIIKPELFLPIWFGLRLVAAWKGWSERTVDGIPGRAMFNITLSGIGLNVIFSIFSIGLIKFLQTNNFKIHLSIPVTFFIVIIIVWVPIFIFTLNTKQKKLN
jgi:hypothetical protein